MIIDGKKIADQILDQLYNQLKTISFRPKLIDVLVGNDPVIESYVRTKAKRSAEIGIDFETVRFDADVKQEQLQREVLKLNDLPKLCGLIIQLPLPKRLDKQKIIDQINPDLDVDAITSVNLGKLFTGQQFLEPATAAAIMTMLDFHSVQLKGSKVLVIGSGDLVGKPLTFLLIQRAATVTVANQSTDNLASLCGNADIIISGAGVAGLIKSSMVPDGIVVIDAGTAESAGGIGGDVDPDDFADIARRADVSPVPGGVGPMTVAMLLNNVVRVAVKKDSSAWKSSQETTEAH